MRFMSLHLLVIPLLLPRYFAEPVASDSASLALGASQCPNDSLRSAQLKRPPVSMARDTGVSWLEKEVVCSG